MTLAAFGALAKRYAPTAIKRRLWDREFASGHWAALNHISDDDTFYACLLEHLDHGRLLDIGCGTGATARDLPSGRCSAYVGVDISAVAIAEARTQAPPWQDFYVGDIETFTPPRAADVILFRESLYYVPAHRVPAVLQRYARFLTPNGCFIIRIWDRERHADTVAAVSQVCITTFVEHHTSRSVVIVARPRP